MLALPIAALVRGSLMRSRVDNSWAFLLFRINFSVESFCLYRKTKQEVQRASIPPAPPFLTSGVQVLLIITDCCLPSYCSRAISLANLTRCSC